MLTDVQFRQALALCAIPGLNANKLFASDAQTASMSELFTCLDRPFETLPLTDYQRTCILGCTDARIDRVLRWLCEPQHHVVFCVEPSYPALLWQTKQPPFALFIDGDLTLLQQPALAIVGSRRPSPSGKAQAYRFSAELSRQGLLIMSGLATGIDSAAHRGALAMQQPTLAVLGHGLMHLYPKSNQALAQEIRQHGALVSEFLPDIAPRAEFFPLRNRIVAGMSLGTLVVEAAEKSGSLISANYAAEYNREVFAIPGSIENPLVAGCHRLIQQGAKLTTCSADILEELAMEPLILGEPLAKSDTEHGKNNLSIPLSDQRLLANVGDEVTSIDVIAQRAQLAAAEVSVALLRLELLGVVAAVSGGYIRVRRA